MEKTSRAEWYLRPEQYGERPTRDWAEEYQVRMTMRLPVEYPFSMSLSTEPLAA